MVGDPRSEYILSKQDEVAWDQGCRFNLAAAIRVQEFFRRFLRHSKGEFAGKPFELLPWQWDRIVKPLFGWIRPDGTRRYRRAYVEIPKKNGKSTLCAGLALYLLIGDREPGAEVYCAAADRRQASIVFSEMRAMIEASPELSSFLTLTTSKKRVDFALANSFFEALSSDAKTKEGYNVSGLIFDELHAQPNRRLWETLEYGGAARRQPLFISITTAGYDRDSICYEQHQYAKQVSKDIIVDPSFLGVIFAAEDEDDWTLESTWAKANPSYGVSIHKDEMAEACKRAQGSPLKENSFKRYRLNIWTEQATRWLGVHLWDGCKAIPKLEGPCYGGLDLASTTDLASAAYYFPQTGGACWQFWTTEDACKERERLNKARLDVWVKQKLITRHEGAVVDYERIRKDINEFRKLHKLIRLGIDRWNAVHLATLLRGDGVDVVGFGQGFVSMNAPMKELEKLIREAKLAHGGHAVARWNFCNLAAEEDAAGNLKPNKKRSGEKIDGLVALVMGIGLAIANPEKKSIYETRGVVTI